MDVRGSALPRQGCLTSLIGRAPGRVVTSSRSSQPRLGNGSTIDVLVSSLNISAAALAISSWRAGAQRSSGLQGLSSSRRRIVAASSGAASPGFEKYSDGLILVVRQAEQEAHLLSLPQLGTDALLLGLLRVEEAPDAEATRQAAFPGVDASAVASVVSKRASPRKTSKTAKGRAGAPLPFTPMARRALSEAEAEQVQLGHEMVEPAHLLLALLKDERGESRALLDHFDQEEEDVRRRLLQTLSGPLARVRLDASDRIFQLREEVATEKRSQKKAKPKPLTTKLSQALHALTDGLIERSVEAKLLLLAALSGEHLFLLGPPGTAKSLLARRLAMICQGFFFERLLTRFSVPEEIFGPLSLKALENDELKRKVEGFLPSADVAFLDEVFKANSSILNALLTLLNERVFDNGGERLSVPLWCTVAASNELPESDELEALFDRFLLRRAVPRVSDAQVPNFLQTCLEQREHSQEAWAPVLSAEDSKACQESAIATTFPDHLLKLVVALRAHLRDEVEPPVRLSDRRLGKAVRLIRLAAHAAGASEVSELDMLLLQHMCWDQEPEQAEGVRHWLLQAMREGADGAVGEKDVVAQARYFFNGVRTRLSRRPRKKVTVSTARRDLAAIAVPLEDQLRLRIRRYEQLQEVLADVESPRIFWLERSEVEEASDMLLPAAKEACRTAEEALQEVLELQNAVDIEEPEAMEMCVDAVLSDFEVQSATESNRAQEDLDKWASGLKIPGNLPELGMY